MFPCLLFNWITIYLGIKFPFIFLRKFWLFSISSIHIFSFQVYLSPFYLCSSCFNYSRKFSSPWINSWMVYQLNKLFTSWINSPIYTLFSIYSRTSCTFSPIISVLHFKNVFFFPWYICEYTLSSTDPILFSGLVIMFSWIFFTIHSSHWIPL